MLEQAEQGRTLSQKAHDALVPALRSELLAAHFALRERDVPVIVIVSGADGAGKGEMVHHLNEWLDPRGVVTHAFWDPSSDEEQRPEYWRFWRAMPGAGRIGILFGSWYSSPIVGRALRTVKRREFEASLDRIVRFERLLSDSGAVLVKLWLHLPKKAQKARLKELEEEGRIGPHDWAHFEEYDRFRSVSEEALERTHTMDAPWHLIEATDRRYREVRAAETLLAAMQAGTKSAEKGGTVRTAKRERTALDAVDLDQRLGKAEYESTLKDLQERLSRLAWAAREAKVATVLAFEGWDAAGKGSAIRRVTKAIDPRLYRVVGVAAPTEEERAQHYLWRFWRQLPRDGAMTIFDRSWYGRVLVERVEGFAAPEAWARAYAEINEFEGQLTEHGVVLLKFWIHISAKEQLKRFRERESVQWKAHKITPDDWRNRKKMPAYREAVEEMVARCSPPEAPWTLVAGNDKRFARVQIVRTIVERLEAAL